MFPLGPCDISPLKSGGGCILSPLLFPFWDEDFFFIFCLFEFVVDIELLVVLFLDFLVFVVVESLVEDFFVLVDELFVDLAFAEVELFVVFVLDFVVELFVFLVVVDELALLFEVAEVVVSVVVVVFSVAFIPSSLDTIFTTPSLISTCLPSIPSTLLSISIFPPFTISLSSECSPSSPEEIVIFPPSICNKLIASIASLSDSSFISPPEI